MTDESLRHDPDLSSCRGSEHASFPRWSFPTPISNDVTGVGRRCRTNARPSSNHEQSRPPHGKPRPRVRDRQVGTARGDTRVTDNTNALVVGGISAGAFAIA